jgi:hypothetical protein
MERAELEKLLKTELDPNLDYYDATASIEAMAEHIRGLHKLINFLATSLMTQGQSIIDIRTKMVEHKGAIELLAAIVCPEEDDRPKLIGFDEPKIVRPN